MGHSNHPFPRLRTLLASHRIDVLVDVRSTPYSHHAPQFNREPFATALGDAGIAYLYLGDTLGGRPARPEHLDPSGHALYGPMAAEPAFEQAIERVRRGARTHRLALLCAEADPTDCHRRLLVGRVLTEDAVELRHILADETLRTETEVKLAAEFEQTDLFGIGSEQWRSTRSVSPRRAPRTSSAA